MEDQWYAANKQEKIKEDVLGDGKWVERNIYWFDQQWLPVVLNILYVFRL